MDGLAFVSAAYPSNAVYVKRGGQIATVLTTGRRTGDGDFLVNILSMDFRDDGSVNILALNDAMTASVSLLCWRMESTWRPYRSGWAIPPFG